MEYVALSVSNNGLIAVTCGPTLGSRVFVYDSNQDALVETIEPWSGHVATGAVVLSRVVTTIILRVSPLDPTVLLGAIVFMALVVAVAAYLPARRATAVAPRTVLQGVTIRLTKVPDHDDGYDRGDD